MDKPKLYVRFWAAPKQERSWPIIWDVNHDGPLAQACLAAEQTMQANTFPTAVRFTIHDYKTDKQVYP